MRVAIDGRLDASAATGVASYARAARAGLVAVGRTPLTLDDDTRGRFGLPVTRVERALRAVRALSPLPVRLARDGARLAASDVFRLAQVRFAASGRLLRLVAPGPPGVMHWTYPIPARIVGWHNVYTVHDVIPLLSDDLSAIDAAGLRRRLLAVAGVAARIVTVSAHARATILDTLGLDPALVRDCGGAVAALEPAGQPLPAGLVAGGYFLFCGLAEPRKNLARTIDAWMASGSRRPLVIVGPDTVAVPHSGVIVLPYQPRGVLVDLIAGARALLFASLEEGFGLPIAEAMTLGTPVLTSDRGAMAEVAGDAALLVDPTDTAAIARGIARLDRDDVLCAALSARGTSRAQAFDAAAFGARLAALYDEFAGASAAPD